MTLPARKEYISAIRARYKKATKTQKSAILDEFCEVCGYSRKYAIRALGAQEIPRKRRPGPKGYPACYRGLGWRINTLVVFEERIPKRVIDDLTMLVEVALFLQ